MAELKIPHRDILSLNLEPIKILVQSILLDNALADHEQKFQLIIDFPRESNDPRELSEIPEVRLWFVRLDAVFPWFPFLLDWKSGELGRYAAMLVPHQFHRTEGIQYNPEALEIFVMGKVFCLSEVLPEFDIQPQSRVKAIAQLLGYDLDDEFLNSITA
ncbi:CRR6 family NdhI maturation factor [Picosynechococcus sp. NKBG15041c]|uniref:CRR6 family NdhI maturation factor n=1 Tax=Picosynechococcus sp. NKBG15041c TaxID=1407650 RepID=UPI0004636ECB|nr:CRR6 family NdhI maturation factor [Picosynechococcus sp. NKBG15041c]